MSTQKLLDVSGSTYIPVVCLSDSSGNPYTASGGSGGGGGLSDTILTDDSGTQFLARDNGTTITYVTLSGAPYTPTTNLRAVSIAGGATAAKQDTGNTSLATLVTNTPTLVSGRQPVDGSGVTQPVSATSLPLPSGASTAANQTTGNTSLASIATNTPTLNADGGSPAHITNATAAGANVQLVSVFYVPSTVNSATAQLASAASFSGTIETAQNQPSVIISALMDQPYTITVTQYDDVAGNKVASVDVITRLANAPYNEAIQVNGNYVKVAVQNNGASTSTTFYVDTFYGIMPVSPRTLTNLSNNRCAIMEVGGVDITGKAIPTSTPIGAPISGQAIIATTGTAVQLPSNVCLNGIAGTVWQATTKVVMGSQSAVTGNVSNGTASTGGDAKVTGQGFAFACSNSNQIWFNGTAGDYLTFSGN